MGVPQLHHTRFGFLGPQSTVVRAPQKACRPPSPRLHPTRTRGAAGPSALPGRGPLVGRLGLALMGARCVELGRGRGSPVATPGLCLKA